MLHNKAIFLDRDGTINEEMGYINHADRFKVFDFVPESIRIFRKLGFKIIVVTNQSGIARGYFSESLLHEIHNKLLVQMNDEHASIDDIFYCPHHPTEGRAPFKMDCECRKPKPGMILQAADKWQLDLTQSFMISDRYKDILFARKLNIRTAMVLTGYGRGEYTYKKGEWLYQPDFIGDNLLDVARQIQNLYMRQEAR